MLKKCVVKVRLLRWMGDNVPRDGRRNECICKKLEFTPVDDKMRENCFKIVWLWACATEADETGEMIGT